MADEMISTAPEPEEMLDGLFDQAEQYELRKLYFEFREQHAKERHVKCFSRFKREIDGLEYTVHTNDNGDVSAYAEEFDTKDSRLKEDEFLEYSHKKYWEKRKQDIHFQERAEIKFFEKGEINFPLIEIKIEKPVLDFDEAKDLLFAALDGMKNYKEKHENHCS